MSEAPMELSEDEAAQRVAEAAENGFPGDRNAQVRNVANAARLLGVSVTLKALAIITQRSRALEGQVDEQERMISRSGETAVETVQFCPVCQTKTWFVDGACEWSDGHAVMEQAPPGANGAGADARLTPHDG